MRQDHLSFLQPRWWPSAGGSGCWSSSPPGATAAFLEAVAGCMGVSGVRDAEEDRPPASALSASETKNRGGRYRRRLARTPSECRLFQHCSGVAVFKRSPSSGGGKVVLLGCFALSIDRGRQTVLYQFQGIVLKFRR